MTVKTVIHLASSLPSQRPFCGIPTVPEGAFNFRRLLPGLYRIGNLSFLSEQGRGELLALRLGRILDLRTRAERRQDAPPFLGRTEYLNLSLLPYRILPFNEATAAAKNNADYTCALLDHGANGIVSILGAILNAPPGPVLIYCRAGKDRTGLVAGLCLELAGVGARRLPPITSPPGRSWWAFMPGKSSGRKLRSAGV